MRYLFISLLVLISFSHLYSQNKEPEKFTDLRDGKSYKIVKIGTQTWMAENLNYKMGNSYCYNDDINNCNKFGRLYEWDTAMKACPNGWHLPSDQEWSVLADFCGGKDNAGIKLNVYGNTGFKGLFAGRKVSSGSYFYLGSLGVFWTSTEVNGDNVWTRSIAPGNKGLTQNSYDKWAGYSVRCLRDK